MWAGQFALLLSYVKFPCHSTMITRRRNLTNKVHVFPPLDLLQSIYFHTHTCELIIVYRDTWSSKAIVGVLTVERLALDRNIFYATRHVNADPGRVTAAKVYPTVIGLGLVLLP